MFQASAEFRKKLDERLARPMVILSFGFLLLVGVLVHGLASPGDVAQPGEPNVRWVIWLVVLGSLLVSWPVFWIEFLAHVLFRDRKAGFGRQEWYGLLVCFVPPLRIGGRVKALDNRIWIPLLGFQTVNRALRQRLEKLFSVPMIVIALLLLPLLALEYGPWEWAKELRERPWVTDFLFISTVVIWFAFAVELVIMVSVAENKLAHCARHWLDLTIVLLPVIIFAANVGVLRLSRLARLEQLGRMGRLYRFRGLWTRAWRAIVLLELIQRLLLRSPAKRLAKLRSQLALKEEEAEELRKEIRALEELIAKKGAARSEGETDPERKPEGTAVTESAAS